MRALGYQVRLPAPAALLLAAMTLVRAEEPQPRPEQHLTCTLEAGPTRSVVRVIDAETVLLDDDEEVRLIGALAPRSPDLRPDAQSWPPEQDTAAALRDLVVGRHARAYGLPDSFACARELLAHERVARAAGIGLWANAAYATRKADDGGKLLRYRNSYQIVEGSVVRVKAAKARTYLDFGRDWRTDFSAGIDGKILRANPEWAKTLAGLEGRKVEVRGWIEYRSGPYIAIEDPSQLAVIDESAPPLPASPAQQRAAKWGERERAAQKKTPGAQGAGRRSIGRLPLSRQAALV